MPAYPRQNTDLTLDHFHGCFTAFPEPFLQRMDFLPTGRKAYSTSVSPTVRYRMPSAGSTARCNFLPAETIPPGSKLETHKAQDGPETYRVHKHSHPHPQVYAGSKMAGGGDSKLPVPGVQFAQVFTMLGGGGGDGGWLGRQLPLSYTCSVSNSNKRTGSLSHTWGGVLSLAIAALSGMNSHSHCHSHFH